ncbi:MAG: pyruvate dehydrogenase complex dihydrolipoamide acetyltransferase [Xanthobacteraceae bacterium]|nr:pyruvate dehydrogenase complex dihydrolipoamide acetyltransferase [Xanthobacteraceae bacterium]MCW5674877.1 pyruvate dehydrogenase complex dihydrolipoamide acetyltransferase [Xanthobacteraceae bacterium]
MPVNILMPALSPTMEKGNLAKWLKKEGDKVKAGDVIAEIETDKATMEVEAVDEGTIAKIMVPEGTADVPVNQVIAVLAEEGEDASAAAKAAPPAPKPQAASTTKAEEPKAAPAPVQAAPAAAFAPVTNGSGGRVFSSPLARRLAKDAGIDLSRVSGSGPHGRVIARDIEAARSGGAQMRAPSGSVMPGVSAPGDDQIRAMYEDGSFDSVPHDSMRKTIARRLLESKLTIPHFYLTTDCDIGSLLRAREEINASAPQDKDGKPVFKLSVNDFIIKAMALALQKIPDANVTWTESAMLKHRHSDIGVAVAIPGGLVTPVIRHAEGKSLSAISNEMKDYAARAKAKKLKPNEFQGGTTAISNLGMYGVKDFAAVINPPQATILAVGAGEKRAVVRGGEIVVADVMTVTLSCDHRAVDGALGAQLLAAFKTMIEKPLSMMA